MSDMTRPQPDFSAVVDLARRAPSVHNTQPWRFRVTDGVLELRRDPERRLTALDPTGRQQVVSCGAALYLARVGLRVQGFDSRVEQRPDPDDADLLARVHPVAGHDVTDDDVVLEHAARHRHTQRGAFDPEPLAPELLARIRAAAEREGAWVRVLTDRDDLVGLTVLLARADEAEREDDAYRSELATWTRRPAESQDGVPTEAVTDVRHRASNLSLRDFALDSGNEPETERAGEDEPPVAERPAAVVIGTTDDSVGDWLVAGQALSALLVRAAVDGVQASPLGQVVDQSWARSRLAAELGVVGHPQMVLRVGHARPGPETPRRPVSDVLG
jgi:hypothetical protein